MPKQINVRNATFQVFDALKRNRQKRAHERLLFVEGVKPITLAAKHGWAFEALLYAPPVHALSGWARSLLPKAREVYELSPALMAELSDKEDPSELIAIVRMRDPYDAGEGPPPGPKSLLVACDRPQNPGNLGTILRTCDAFGVQALFLLGHAADPFDPACIRASIGTVFVLPIFQLAGPSALQTLRDAHARAGHPLHTVGTSAKGTCGLSETDLCGPTLLLLGNETDGLSYALKEACDTLAAIPIHGHASSLNVACAASICLYEIARQRGHV